MAFQPSSSDIPEVKGGFVPSHSDINEVDSSTHTIPPLPENHGEMIDTVLGKMPYYTTFREGLKGLGLAMPETDEERRAGIMKRSEAARGAEQELLNFPIKAINLVKKKPIPEFDFAPKTKAAEEGALIGDIGSFFIPGGALGGGLKALTYLPKIGKSINAVMKASKASPVVNSLLNIGKTGTNTAVTNAVNNPENAKNAALEGLGIGGGTEAALNLITTQNPILRTLARAGAGAGIGYGLGHPGLGAAAGIGAPEFAKMIGLGGKNALAEDMLEGLNYKDVSRATAANKRLGTAITPAQASGNYVTAGTEGDLKRSPQGAQYGYRQEQMQTRQQKQAINKMLDNLYQPTPKNEAEINRLYGIANTKNINPNVVNKMKENPIVAAAFKTVKSDPAFTAVPENNYKYLAEVDRQLFRDYDAALGNKPNSAYAIGQVKNSFNNFLKQANPDYERATEAAQPKMVREHIEGKLNKNEEDYTGKNFYSKFLSNRNAYRDILQQTKNFPEVQEAIKDMRAGWKHLSNMKTVSQGEAQSKTGLTNFRDQFKAMVNYIKKISGARSDVKGLKYIYSKDWDKDFDRIAEIKDQKSRNRELLRLLGRVATAYGVDVSAK